MKRVEMIVPCYNEGQCVKLLAEEVNKVFSENAQYEWNILFVNDGSADNTLDVVKTCVTEYGTERIKYISFSRNFGKEAAILAGLEHATGDYIALMDADLQHPPKLLIEMIAGLEEGYDVCGARRVSRKGEPVIRSILSKRFYYFMNKVTGIQMTPGGSDFRVMTKAVAEAMVAMPERQRFTKGIFSWVGFKTKWIPYTNVERVAGETKWSMRGLAGYAINGFFSFATTPLRMAVWLGFTVDIITLIAGIMIFIRQLRDTSERTGYASIVLLIAFFGGTIILILGIIGEYLARIYIEVKNRPIYIVQDTNIE